MKSLIIVAHPSLDTSVVNKRWVDELEKHPDKYTVHQLYKAYPDETLDIRQEQQLIEAHGNLVLQFPVYWFSSPSLLKKWLDEVFTFGWAYGPDGGDKLAGRKMALAVSAGGRKESYSPNGKYGASLDQLLSPFSTTFHYCSADYRSYFAFYGMETEPGENVPGAEFEPPAVQLEKSTRDYLAFIEQL